MCYVFCFFFFFKQKTAYEMRTSDWSSDVCSSDLAHALNHFGSGANKAIVLNNDRISLQRLKHTADADTAGQMHILADLGAASTRHPGIHHGALIDKSADVDEARHQHDLPCDLRSMPSNGTRQSTETGGAELRPAPALNRSDARREGQGGVR